MMGNATGGNVGRYDLSGPRHRELRRIDVWESEGIGMEATITNPI